MHRRQGSGGGAMEIGEEAPELGAEPLSLTSDTPLLRAQIKHSIEDAQAFGTRLKSVHKLADSYAQALNTAAACWVELIAELREVAVDLPLSDEGEQVAASLTGLSEQVVQVLAAPLRAFYDNEIKPIRETKKSYDKVRQKYDDAERRSLSLKHQAEPDKVRQADEELRAKKWQLELQRFDMYAELESVQLRRKLLPQHAADFLHAHVACFHTSFGVLSAMETRSMVERVEAMGVTLEERKQLRQRERLQVAGQSQRHGTALSPGEQGAREAVVVADAELGSQQQGLLFHQVCTTNFQDIFAELKRCWRTEHGPAVEEVQAPVVCGLGRLHVCLPVEGQGSDQCRRDERQGAAEPAALLGQAGRRQDPLLLLARQPKRRRAPLPGRFGGGHADVACLHSERDRQRAQRAAAAAADLVRRRFRAA